VDGTTEALGADNAATQAMPNHGRPPSRIPQMRIEVWDWQRFRRRAILREAARNQGQVELAEDLLQGRLVAVKAMPTSWVCESPAAFKAAHPEENELPWCDIAATFHLSCIARLSCVCTFVGIFQRNTVVAAPDAAIGSSGESPRSAAGTPTEKDEKCLVLSYCAGGDLFSWLERSLAAGCNGTCRETLARPLLHRLFQAVSDVHAQGVAHGDLSLENILLFDNQDVAVCLIDFGASTGSRASGVRGKPSYQAPEMHTDLEYDAFLADAFSLGVLVFSLVVGDYPWLSTKPHRCSKYMFFTQRGMVSYLSRRKVRNGGGDIITLAALLSPEITAILEGLLCVDPLHRLSVDAALQSSWFPQLGQASSGGSARVSDAEVPS